MSKSDLGVDREYATGDRKGGTDRTLWALSALGSLRSCYTLWALNPLRALCTIGTVCAIRPCHTLWPTDLSNNRSRNLLRAIKPCSPCIIHRCDLCGACAINCSCLG